VKEEYDRTGDNTQAVADGLARTARVITAAASIMVCVFGAFVLGPERAMKLFGFGMAAAVLIDATIVRLVLCRPRWSSSGTGTGGSRSGSTGYCPTSPSRASGCSSPRPLPGSRSPTLPLENPRKP
jgi:hypothetical protein